MVGNTLVEIREHVESLASDDGTYHLVCARTGYRPIPVAGKRFPDRETARSAARAAEQYRAALRRYDPGLPYHDLVVCQDAEPGVAIDPTRSRAAEGADEPRSSARADGSRPGSTPIGEGATGRRELVEFCHGVAAAVFETLGDAGHGTVERAVVDDYLALAETISDPDELCLCLLESLSTELATSLDPAERADVLARAAARLPPTAPDARDEEPVTAALDRLHGVGLVGDYARTPGAVDLADGTRSVVLRISEYALSPRDGRLPVLPVVLELRRRRLDRPPSSCSVVGVDDGWRVEVTFARSVEAAGLASAPIRGDGR